MVYCGIFRGRLFLQYSLMQNVDLMKVEQILVDYWRIDEIWLNVQSVFTVMMNKLEEYVYYCVPSVKEYIKVVDSTENSYKLILKTMLV